MLTTYNSEKLLGLEDVFVKKVTQMEDHTEIEIEKPRVIMKCPCCGAATSTIHDYRSQKVKDIPSFGHNVVLILRKRRYRCLECHKRFCEDISFLPPYHRMTNRLVAYVLDKLACECSFTSVAREVNLSISTIIRLFDLVEYPLGALPKVLGIDEFRGNTGGEKYQCILTDVQNRVVLDILPKRFEHCLVTYFKKKNRADVDYFVSDMWKPYAQLADNFFSKAIPVVDKYHFIRQVIWAFEAVRKEQQKSFSKSHRQYFKRSKSLLTKQYEFLKPEQQQEVDLMLSLSPTLASAHFLKERFQKILSCPDRNTAKTELSAWIDMAARSKIPPFVSCADTMMRWRVGILNAFVCSYSNGFTEGCNNKIKVLKHNAYGYRNFNRFRNRILHMFRHQATHKQSVAC